MAKPTPKGAPRSRAGARRRRSWFPWLARLALGWGGIFAVVRSLRWLAESGGQPQPVADDARRAVRPAPPAAPASPAVRPAEEPRVHPSVRYEPQDVGFGWILGLALLACGIAAIHYYAMLQFYWGQRAALDEQRASPYVLVPEIAARLPPQPRLEQINHLEHIWISEVALRQAARERVLQNYGPTGEEGFVHIPIQRAIQAVAGTLPVNRAWQPPPQARGLVNWGASNSGRDDRGAAQ